ncbi:hypothetical protein C8R44DRAFT_738319 [Mycena epipterygia]|nr:hypothetical protein C8R44DRAFT_738319 [Mycena epipterygia]
MCLLLPCFHRCWQWNPDLDIIFPFEKRIRSIQFYTRSFLTSIQRTQSIADTDVAWVAYCRTRGPTSYPFVLIRLRYANLRHHSILMKLEGDDSHEKTPSLKIGRVDTTVRGMVGTWLVLARFGSAFERVRTENCNDAKSQHLTQKPGHSTRYWFRGREKPFPRRKKTYICSQSVRNYRSGSILRSAFERAWSPPNAEPNLVFRFRHSLNLNAERAFGSGSVQVRTDFRTERCHHYTWRYDVYQTVVFPHYPSPPKLGDFLALADLANARDCTQAVFPATVYFALKTLFDGTVSSRTKRGSRKSATLANPDVADEVKRSVIDAFPALQQCMQTEIKLRCYGIVEVDKCAQNTDVQSGMDLESALARVAILEKTVSQLTTALDAANNSLINDI